MSVKPGEKAPIFTLIDTKKKEVSLADYKGKNVVLLFFALAFTGVCTKELCSIRDDIASYEEFDAEVLAVSVDTVFSLGKFKEEQQLNFKLLSDFNRTVCRAYGAFYEEFVLKMRGVAKRSAFVIDEQGFVRYAEVLDSDGDIPDFQAVKDILAQLN